MKIFSQYLILIFVFMSFFLGLYQDFNGRPARPRGSFGDAVITTAILLITLIICFLSGALSEIVGAY